MTPHASTCLLVALACTLACTREARAADPPPKMLATVVPAWAQLATGAPITGLQRPLLVTHANDGSGRLFIVEQTGKVRVVKDGVVQPEPFLDVGKYLGAAEGEQGLLGLAFHPKFKDNGRLFIAYTDKDEDDAYAELRATDDRKRADLKTIRGLFAIEDFAGNHNGGHLAFGPDGLLYIGTGDGGGAGDPQRTAQDPMKMLGKMLVLDVDALPAQGNVTPRVLWKGLRNPWRYSFDKRGDLYIGDVGQNLWEELHVVERARLADTSLDFGWSKVEGTHCFRPNNGCDAAGTERVVFEYPHGRDGCSITGGVSFNDKDATHVFGDYCTGRVWLLRKGPTGAWQVAHATDLHANISSFGLDEKGNVYLVDHGGEVVPLTLSAPATPAPAPKP